MGFIDSGGSHDDKPRNRRVSAVQFGRPNRIQPLAGDQYSCWGAFVALIAMTSILGGGQRNPATADQKDAPIQRADAK
jgi:hypothetical protein